MPGLRTLSLVYLASASAFGVAIVLHSDAQWAIEARSAARFVAPYLSATADIANEKAVKPSVAWAVRKDIEFFDWINRQPVLPPAPVQAKLAPAPPPALRPAIIEEPNKEIAAAPPQVARAQPPQAPPPDLVPAPDANPPSPADLARVSSHIKLSLTKELYDNFELFLYVSKAERGPWAQRMYVFRKATVGNLNLLYHWPVSTGRELIEVAPTGATEPTITPQGYYEFDPERMYRRYHSMQWGQPMPYAMFFNWEKGGYQTGLAIHGAAGDSVAFLGKRSSAGCVRLALQNAQLLYRLIHSDYKGPTPRFAYDRRTATMSNDGMLMRDASGSLKYADGYKVLVFIENNGGDNVVAALF